MRSKFLYILVALISTSTVTTTSSAAESNSSDKPPMTAGPNGGRLMKNIDPYFEFFLMKDRKIKITFLNKNGKIIPPKKQQIMLVGGNRSSPTKLSFSKKENFLISNDSIPKKKNFPLVLLIKANPEADPVIERFILDSSDCRTCDYKEYACVCSH